MDPLLRRPRLSSGASRHASRELRFSALGTEQVAAGDMETSQRLGDDDLPPHGPLPLRRGQSDTAREERAERAEARVADAEADVRHRRPARQLVLRALEPQALNE